MIEAIELEHELCRIPGVTAARVVMDPEDVPVEVHVLATTDKHAKQLVRDVQSVAITTFGLDIDRRVVSVVQLDQVSGTSTGSGAAGAAAGATQNGDQVDPGAAAAAGPLASAEPERLAVEGVGLSVEGLRTAISVTLRQRGRRVVGSREGSSSPTTVMRLVAQATLDALQEVLPAAERADVDAVRIVRLGDRSVAIATIVVVVPSYEEVLAGAAVVRASGEHDAMARAILDATNRRLPRLG
ncbi:MAG TPA: hypothetical protein VKI64_09995 [Acidimicrobiales bacterium]|nr:hypothetical protein [Acidimicrobiales bacterium]